ncbi:hypothetical protein P879_01764 [Paragonimus westermani]|uniref:SHSP domain-containing protein n=1 Tax=Paragonimus westermani TaxID=34504 RepID=A0A8T0DFB1_9TREM|nr:hypothetical protein P879_01764 [Paragonimus westermani]
MISHISKHIPIQKVVRTLEQCQKDMVSKLRHVVADPSNKSPTEKEKTLQVHTHEDQPDWPKEVNKWIDGIDRTWNAEMRRMRNSLFPLLPVDLFDHGVHELLAPYGDVSSILDRMDRQMEAMRRPIEAVFDRQQMLREADDLSSDPLDYLKDAYELGEDGRVHFKVRFNVEGYGPEDIQVNTSEHGLTVHAKKSVKDETGTRTRGYFRTIYLPPSIDKDHFQAHMTEDGVLTLETPVTTKLHNAVTFNRDHQLALKPLSEAEVKQRESTEHELALKPTGTIGPTVIKDETTGGEKLHVEIPIEPEFTADDLCVRMDANRVIVSGRKQCVDKTGSSKGDHVKEFSRSYEIPETVDTFSINTQLHGNTLLVEAPLLHPSKPK